MRAHDQAKQLGAGSRPFKSARGTEPSPGPEIASELGDQTYVQETPMPWKPVLLLAALAAGPAAAQVPPPGQSPPASAVAATPPPAFPPGVEVLSVEGEPLGVLARVESRADGERILHIRRPDGSLTWAPSVVASRGERAVVLDWTRAEFEAGQTSEPPPAEVAAAPTPPT